MCARRGVLPAADGQACSGGYVRVCVYVWLGSGSGPSQSPSVLSVTAQRAGADVSGLHHGRWAVAPAPRFQLYVHCVAPCRAQRPRPGAV